MLQDAATALKAMRDNLDKVYYQGKSLDSRCIDALADGGEKGDFQALTSWAASYGDRT